MAILLSLNTQLTKLRLSISTLKAILPALIFTTESGYKDKSHYCVVRDIIYSLRDTLYELKGLPDYKASRSNQMRHYSIKEVLQTLLTIADAHSSFNANVADTLRDVKTNLETVDYYIDTKNNNDLF